MVERDNPLYRYGVLNVPDRCNIDEECREINPTLPPSRYGKFGMALLTLGFWFGPLLALAVLLFMPEPHLSHAWGKVFDHPLWRQNLNYDGTAWSVFCQKFARLTSPPSRMLWLHLGMAITGKVVPLGLGLLWLVALRERWQVMRKAPTRFLWKANSLKASIVQMALVISFGVSLPLLILAVSHGNAYLVFLAVLGTVFLPFYFLLLMLIDCFAPLLGLAAFSVYGQEWEWCIGTLARFCRWFTLRNLRLQFARFNMTFFCYALSAPMDYLWQSPNDPTKTLQKAFATNRALLVERLKPENEAEILEDFAPSLMDAETIKIILFQPVIWVFCLYLYMGVPIKMAEEAFTRRQVIPRI